ncbi:hypothetical protein KY284_026480 [Solanum tuberosum]|nr:hypothetical protein KY284_026480 [Solanum tuberosum]
MASGAQKLSLPRAPPKPLNPSTSDFPPLNGLTISTNPNEQIYPKDPQINYATALGVSNGRTSKKTVKLQHRPYELLEGKPVVSFSKEENDRLAKICKLTIVGKFMRIRPSIEKIREDFSKNIPIKGDIKMTVAECYIRNYERWLIKMTTKTTRRLKRAGMEPPKDSTPSHMNMEVEATKSNLNEGTPQTGQQEANEANKDEEGWKTVTKGKGKNKYKEGSNPFKKSTEGEPVSEKVQIIKNVKEISGQSDIGKMGVFGMTFTAQNKDK